MKLYRFFYHYYKQKGKMSVHFRNKCLVVDDVNCVVQCVSKWKKSQPRLVMQGWAEDVTLHSNKGRIEAVIH